MGSHAVDNTCLKCGSNKIIPNVAVIDQGQYSDGSLKAFLGNSKPDAWLLKGPIFAHLQASICGECGFTEMVVGNPTEIYRQYLDLMARQNGESSE